MVPLEHESVIVGLRDYLCIGWFDGAWHVRIFKAVWCFERLTFDHFRWD